MERLTLVTTQPSGLPDAVQEAFKQADCGPLDSVAWHFEVKRKVYLARIPGVGIFIRTSRGEKLTDAEVENLRVAYFAHLSDEAVKEGGKPLTSPQRPSEATPEAAVRAVIEFPPVIKWCAIITTICAVMVTGLLGMSIGWIEYPNGDTTCCAIRIAR